MDLEQRIKKLEQQMRQIDMRFMAIRCIEAENSMYLHNRVVVFIFGIIFGIIFGRILEIFF
ncbi:hypothetical protein FQB35_09940 [Crassaminicella thermophila]|uniref:Uncharacterized protein n=1 Tax=Crassaminicella thermophila TaxID=2599308 RepID=A0A5C0SE77_CRATE|nr:hypothetical protein [Crassaminicella thermophila]QEK12621.1 hypothetical protein FQB35_09940 [Crassaminicella thermophila]